MMTQVQGVPFERLLNAQRTLAQAESDYFRSLTNYAKAISQVHYRKGSLLEYNGVFLAEGPWPAKAYFDARRRARARAAAHYIDYGYHFSKAVQRRAATAVHGSGDGRRGNAVIGPRRGPTGQAVPTG